MVRPVGLQASLERELKRLQRKYGYGKHLKVVILPQTLKVNDKTVFGEVKDSIIYIYQTEECLKTLRHEFLEEMIKSTFADPYVYLYNAFTKVFEKIQRNRTEKLIEILAELEDF